MWKCKVEQSEECSVKQQSHRKEWITFGHFSYSVFRFSQQVLTVVNIIKHCLLFIVLNRRLAWKKMKLLPVVISVEGVFL